MNNFIFPLLMAMGQGQQTGAETGGGGLLTTMLPLVLIVAIFYFLMIRPQNKKRKETEQMLSALKKGDKIITIGGIHGTVQSVKETTVIIKVDENVKLEFLRSAVSNVTAAGKEEKEKIEDESQSSETGE